MSLTKKYYNIALHLQSQGFGFEEFPNAGFIVLTENGKVIKKLEGQEYKEFIYNTDNNKPEKVNRFDFLLVLLHAY